MVKLQNRIMLLRILDPNDADLTRAYQCCRWSHPDLARHFLRVAHTRAITLGRHAIASGILEAIRMAIALERTMGEPCQS